MFEWNKKLWVDWKRGLRVEVKKREKVAGVIQRRG
jgi:hypothetical protein